MIKEYTFNTGVKPFSHNPPAGMAFMSGFRDSGNGVYVIPFECEEVPEGFKFAIGCDYDDIPFDYIKSFNQNIKTMDDVIIREILPGSRMLSKYAYFVKKLK
jgi:hypothetical protein